MSRVPAPPRDLPVAVIAVLIGTTPTIGLLTATLPKLRWSAFRRDRCGHPPYLGWLVSASLAAVLAFGMDRAAIAIAVHDPAAGLDFANHHLSPMAPMAFVVSLAIAILCDVDLRIGEGWMRRVSEGMLCGAVMAIAIFVFTHLIGIRPATAGQAPHWFPLAFFIFARLRERPGGTAPLSAGPKRKHRLPGPSASFGLTHLRLHEDSTAAHASLSSRAESVGAERCSRAGWLRSGREAPVSRVPDAALHRAA